MLSIIQSLKISLMEEGLSLASSARRQICGPITLADYPSTSGITIVLEKDIWVNAPIVDFNENFLTNPPHVLVFRHGQFLVESNGDSYEADILPVPSYHDKNSEDGTPYIWSTVTHSDRARVSPIGGCANVCLFCDMPEVATYRKKPIAEMIESLRVALNDQTLPAKHVLISGGTPRPEDYEWLNEAYEEITCAFPAIDIDVMMTPVPDLLCPKKLKDCGIRGLSINLELWDQQIAQKIIPQKANIGRETYLGSIEHSVDVFGAAGAVRSLLLVGIESVENTLRGVEALAKLGCDPVLSPFRPGPATAMRNSSPPSVAMLTEVYERSVEITENYGVKLGPRCIPCQHNTLTFPDRSGAYYYSECNTEGGVCE